MTTKRDIGGLAAFPAEGDTLLQGGMSYRKGIAGNMAVSRR